jgi:hypothetical protein
VLLPDDPDDPDDPHDPDPDDPEEPLAPEVLDDDSFVVEGVDEDESEEDFSAGFAPSELLVAPDPFVEARESFR